ncbi:uncharacterized protein EMH_0088470 [Eimeria mitis]|uniref:Uncharacterized protein n=1 Tax=Eimeria mitis TaxID=44415 RepID=U6KD61_9EIME|nr:uncharacterized protein EMH_0088470 [Eimeria mitis]CDJ34192.1 hypothetical protein EMH_0088470 [Eimeria mitis]
MQLLRQQQQQRVQGIHLQQAGQQLSLLLPLLPLFSVTSRLFSSLKNDDPQHVKLAADIGGLWRVCGYGVPPGTPQRTATAAAVAAAAAAAAQFVSFFNPLRSGLQEALKGGLAARIGDSCTAATAVAALVEALGQTDGQLREVMRTWRRQFMPK